MREPTELDSRVAGACGVSADSFDALGLRCTSLPFRDTCQPPRPEQNACTDRDCRVRAGPAITAPRRALAPTFLGVRGLVGLSRFRDALTAGATEAYRSCGRVERGLLAVVLTS